MENIDEIDFTRLEGQLITDEALKLKLYKCKANKWTIGVGHNIQDNGITKDIAMYILKSDIDMTIKDLKANFLWFKNLDSYRKEVIINMCFNLGIVKLKKFTKTIKALKKGDYVKASIEMLDSKWAKEDVGSRAIRLADIMRGYNPLTSKV